MLENNAIKAGATGYHDNPYKILVWLIGPFNDIFVHTFAQGFYTMNLLFSIYTDMLNFDWSFP